MASLIFLAGAGYAYYQQQEARFRLDEGIDLEDPSLQSVEFLPAEVSSSMLQSTISTITFYEGGSYETVRSKLEARVDAIRAANPWLGGIVAQRRSDPYPRLFYGTDAGSSTIETPSSFQTFDLGAVPFTSRTPYHQYEDLMREYRLKVPTLPELVGSRKHPLWKVTLLPDAADPDHKFAIIVSMAHALGDAHTFYQLYHMLGNLDAADHDDHVDELNVLRIPEFQQELQERLGMNESTFFNTANPALWERTGGGSSDSKAKPLEQQQKRHKEHELLLFTIRPEWMEQQRNDVLAAATATNTNSQPSASGDDDDESALEAAKSLSNESILVSWFFRDICEPTIGLVAKSNLRNFCSCLGELDAGNYQVPIPLVGPIDYETPIVVQQALGSGKRSGIIVLPTPPTPTTTTNTVDDSTTPAVPAAAAPQLTATTEMPSRVLMAAPNAKFGLGVDWTRLLPQGELRLLSTSSSTNDTEITQSWHWPLHDVSDLDCLPPRCSAFILFTAKNGTMGALCLVSSQNNKEMSTRIIASGIVDETIAVM